MLLRLPQAARIEICDTAHEPIASCLFCIVPFSAVLF
jgi:hypothetical protein